MNLQIQWVLPGFLLLISGCTTISPTLQQSDISPPDVFSHARFDHALQQSVNDRGVSITKH